MNNNDVPGMHPLKTVLVVEDEVAVLCVLQQMLSRQGMRVITASSPQEALDLWDKHRNEVDMLLTDLFFNEDCNGKDLAMVLHQHKPGLAIILASGDICSLEVELWLEQNQAQFLMKPFHYDELLSKVTSGFTRISQSNPQISQ